MFAETLEGPAVGSGCDVLDGGEGSLWGTTLSTLPMATKIAMQFVHMVNLMSISWRQCGQILVSVSFNAKTTGGACNYLGDLDPLVSPLQVIYNPRNYDLAGL